MVELGGVSAKGRLCDRCRSLDWPALNNDLPERVQRFYSQFWDGSLQAVLTPGRLEGMSHQEYWCLLDRGCRVTLYDDALSRSIKWHLFNLPAKIAEWISFSRIDTYGLLAICCGTLVWKRNLGFGAAVGFAGFTGYRAAVFCLRIWSTSACSFYFSDPRPILKTKDWHAWRFHSRFAISCLRQILCVGGQALCFSRVIPSSLRGPVYWASVVGSLTSMCWDWGLLLSATAGRVLIRETKVCPDGWPWFSPENERERQLVAGSSAVMFLDHDSLDGWLNFQPTAVGDLMMRFASDPTYNYFAGMDDYSERSRAHFFDKLSQAKGFYQIWTALGRPSTSDPIFEQLRVLWGICQGIQYKRDERRFDEMSVNDEKLSLDIIVNDIEEGPSFCVQDESADSILEDIGRLKNAYRERAEQREEPLPSNLLNGLGLMRKSSRTARHRRSARDRTAGRRTGIRQSRSRPWRGPIAGRARRRCGHDHLAGM